MAKGRGRGSSSDAHVSTPSLTPRVAQSFVNLTPLSTYLSMIEDRRTWHPDGPTRAARSIPGGSPSQVVIKKAPAKFKRPYSYVPTDTRFAVPEKTIVCIRRQRRKEVLFAKKKTGRGRGRKNPKRSYWSAISCKR